MLGNYMIGCISAALWLLHVSESFDQLLHGQTEKHALVPGPCLCDAWHVFLIRNIIVHYNYIGLTFTTTISNLNFYVYYCVIEKGFHRMDGNRITRNG